MPSSCPNGVCTTGQNGVEKSTSKSVPNNRHKNAGESKQHNVKSSRGTKHSRGQPPSEGNSSTLDGTQSTVSRHPSSQSSIHSAPNPTDFTKPPIYSESSINPEDRMSGTRYTPPSSADAATTGGSTNSTKPATTFAPNTVSPTMYDPALLQSYLAQVQGYVPGLPCSIPNCSTCYPMLDSTGYMSNTGAQPVQPSMLMTRSLLGGMGSTGATGTAPSPCYVWVNQDAETQKQMYQAQLALSQLSLNSATAGVNQNYGMSPDCSMGVPLIQTNQTVEPGSGASQILTASPQSEASMYTAQSVVYPLGTTVSNGSQSRAVSETRFPCATQSNNPIVSPLSYPNGNNTNNQGLGICVGTTGMDNAMWTGNYLSAAAAAAAAAGTGNLWIPPPYPTYAQQYYPALSVPVASISSPGVVNYEDPNTIQQGSVDRCYSNPAISIGDKYPACPQDYYYSPGANLSPGSVLTGPAKLSGPKTFAPLQMISPTTSMFATQPVQPQLGSGVNPTSWQSLLSALTTPKQQNNNNNQSINSNLVRHPLSSYHLSLDRARLSGSRKRMPISFAARAVTCKEFNPIELQALNLGVNPVELDTSLLFRARYFVIKSDCEYNVHQSIRHGVWCSTRSGNQCLNDAYQSVQEPEFVSFTNTGIETQTEVLDSNNQQPDKSNNQLRGHILLFFSVRSSGYLNGVAEMIGPVDPQKRCSIWQDSRFRGEIPVRWLYVKNVPAQLIKHISIESYDNRSVTVLRDTSEITPASKGEELLRIVHGYGLPRSVCPQQPY